MRLYRIMLVDDEAEVRESIIRKIDWETLGFQLVGDAENGAEALEKVEILEPDIVLTDIRMPYMDGLELARRIHMTYPSIKLVIFSGFDEFEYAKQAIKLNVIEYILKPVNVDELTQILRKIKQTLDDEVRRRRNVEELREMFVKSLPILRERLLYDLTHDRVEPYRIPGLMKEYRMDIADAASWTAAYVVIEKPDGERGPGISWHEQSELIPISVQRITEEVLGGYTKFSVFSLMEEICIVAAVPPADTLDGLIAVLNDICRECGRVLELTVTMGLGRAVESLDKLSSSFREAAEAAGCTEDMSAGSVIYIGDIKRGEGRPNSAQGIVEEAKLFIQEHYREQEMSLEAVCNNLHVSAAYFSTVFKRETGQSYVNYLTNLRLEKAVELLKRTDEKTYLIADKVGYSDPNYFSYVFKKHFGVSPTKYRTQNE